MSWERIKSGDGAYEVNWDGVRGILRPWARALLTAQSARWTASEKHWDSPDIYTVEVDWPKVHRGTDMRSEAELLRYRSSAAAAILPLIGDLERKIEQTHQARRNVTGLMRLAQNLTMQNIEGSIHVGQIGVKVATHIRNASAASLLIGATVMSAGGAALPAFLAGGTGNALTRVGNYQDSGFTHAGRAAAAFATDLVLMLVPLAEARAVKSVTDTGTKLFVQLCFVKVESLLTGMQVTMVEGGHVQEAALKGLVHFTGASHERIVESVFESNPKLKKWIIPVVFHLLEAGAEKVVEGLDGKAEPKSDPKPSTKAHQLMDAAVVDPHLIERTAIRRAKSQAA